MKVGCSLAWSVLLVTVLSAQCCLVEKDWTRRSTYDLLDMADVVVYGRDTGHVERSGVHFQTRVINVTDCLFNVYCVLKGNVTMKNITIEHINPLSSCSGSRNKLNVGMEMIVTLKMTESGNFKYYEGNALQSSVYESSAENFRTMDNVTKTSEWQVPSDVDEDTCQSALEKVTTTTKGISELPNNTTFIPSTQAKDTGTKVGANQENQENSAGTAEPPNNTTLTPSTQAKDTGAKVGANLENQENSAGTVELPRHSFFLTLTVLPICYMCLC
ncbi:hypothetical protein KP79_PYT11645 [Mizuhopecten yessoensis]|uniref:Uncharacterized protein n=1 Tax=Mizuhopecten yessoensis TaxID=6573 RepID=A0A210R4I3_MIZYE|nr:hypothetical protein KP79_PYT11645 [Mizuhopecten yessoensis]